MIVVVVGDLELNSPKDKEYVLSLMEELKSRYSDLTIVSSACEKGTGYFVRERCITNRVNPDFGFIELSIRVWTILSRAKLAQVYMSRNPALNEIGEIFHIFKSDKEIGHISDLIIRVKNANKPLAIHYQDGRRELFNYPTIHDSSKTSATSIQSADLKSQLE